MKTLSLQWRENGTSVPRGSGESMPEHSSEPRGLWEASGPGTVGKACSKTLHASGEGLSSVGEWWLPLAVEDEDEVRDS